MTVYRFVTVLFLFALLAPFAGAGTGAPLSSSAQVNSVTENRANYQEIGKWDFRLGIGAGVRTNPLASGDNIPLILIPQVSYTGERFFIQNLDIGWLLLETDTQQLNLLATPSYDQVFFTRWNPGNFFLEGNGFLTAGTGPLDNRDNNLPLIDSDKNSFGPKQEFALKPSLRKRRSAGLAGFEYSVSFNLVDVQLQYLHDFTAVHRGEEWRIALSKYWSSGRHRFTASLGALWQSREIINYYYGISAAEADVRGAYNSGPGLTGLARVEWSYQLTKRWDLRFFASYRDLPAEISASPLLENNQVVTVFVGGMYHF